MNKYKTLKDDDREKLKEEVFNSTQEIEEEIGHLKSELKGYKKMIKDLDRASHHGWFRFWMAPVGIVIIFIGFVSFIFISQFVKYYNLAKEGVSPDLISSLTLNTDNSVKSNPNLIIEAAKLATSDDPSIGPDSAKITLIEFGDFQCPFSLEAYPIVKQILNRYPNDIKFIYRDFPLDSIHSMARKAAEASECAHEQGKFWEYHNQLFEKQSSLESEDNQFFYKIAKDIGLDEKKFTTCFGLGKYKTEVEDDYQAGLSTNLRGTPTWFFNGQKVEGSISLETFESIVQKLLK